MAREAITCKEPQAKPKLRTLNHSHNILEIKQENEMAGKKMEMLKMHCVRCL